MTKVIVYADTVREARKFYPGKEGESVGHRAAGEFTEVEECDEVIYMGDYPDIKEAYGELEDNEPV